MLLSVTALLMATLFAGAALYISLVEHPVRLGLDDDAMLAQWQPSYKRALPMQAALAVIGSVVGLIVFCQLQEWQWLVGSAVLLANWPFTLVCIMPTNKRLMGMKSLDAGVESRQLLRRWGGLHNVRSVLGSIASIFFTWGILVA